MKFSDRTDRIEIRASLENETGTVCMGYSGDTVTFGMPRGEKLIQAENILREYGLKIIERAYFPLCSDKPSMDLRHDSYEYGVKNCNWLFYKCV